MFKKVLFSLSLLLFFCSYSYSWEMNWDIKDIKIPWFSQEEADQFAVVWEDSMGLLEKALKRLDKSEDLPEEKLIGNDKRKNDEKIDKILMEVIQIMSDSDLKDMESNILQTREDILEGRRKLALLREKEIAASEKGSLFSDSREDLREKIADQEKTLEEKKAGLKNLDKRLLSAFRKTGIKASDEQIRSLLSGVTADDVVGMYSVYENIKLFSDQLEKLMEQNSQDVMIARRYYGIYALLIRTSVVMNERFALKIDEDYIPSLDDMERKASELMNDIKGQISQSDLSYNQELSLKSNLQSSELTLKAIRNYKTYLTYQRDQALNRSRKMELDYSVAYNAYRTMKLARGFLDLVKSSKKDLNALNSLEIPEMALFSNESLRKEFQNITESLR